MIKEPESFNLYSQYYDLLNSEKNYSCEVDYIFSILPTKIPPHSHVLELGCGTGLHAIELASRGYKVHGIDLSRTMLNVAEARIKTLGREVQERISLVHGDIRTFRNEKHFDLCLSLFHVMSYQTTEQDFLASLKTAYDGLSLGGLFIFDIWFGPAVLFQQPTTRIKRIETSSLKIYRLCEPTLITKENLVKVEYEILCFDKISGQFSKTSEVHNMRYWFDTELTRLLPEGGFELVQTSEWLSNATPSQNTWSVTVVARKRA